MPLGPGGEVTIGELYRSISGLKADMAAQFEIVNRRFDSLQFVHRETYAAEMTALRAEIAADREEINELKERFRWGGRAIIVSFVFPILVSLVVMALAVGR